MYDQHHEDSFPEEAAEEEEEEATGEFVISCSLTPSPSEDPLLCSIQSEGGTSSGSESLELYQPSSPFKITEEFILPDIIEESEELEVDITTESALTDREEHMSDTPSLHSSLADGELDIKETSFSNEHFFNDIGHSYDVPHQNQEPEVVPQFDPPTFPISPPPGPLLSPELEAHTEFVHENNQQQKYNPKNYRHSVAGALEDMPPPLPMTEPPGRLISPRHSSGFLDLAELSIDGRKGSRGHRNISQLVLKMNRVSEANGPTEGENGASGTIEEAPASEGVNSETQSDDVLTLVPPIQDHPDGVFDNEGIISRQRLGSYHLKTFEPPREFSDSGFQDTDVATADHTSRDNNSTVGISLATLKPTYASDSEDKSADSLTIRVMNSAIMSDEQLTENSGSIDVKTFASSGSEVSEANWQGLVYACDKHFALSAKQICHT